MVDGGRLGALSGAISTAPGPQTSGAAHAAFAKAREDPVVRDSLTDHLDFAAAKSSP